MKIYGSSGGAIEEQKVGGRRGWGRYLWGGRGLKKGGRWVGGSTRLSVCARSNEICTY